MGHERDAAGAEDAAARADAFKPEIAAGIMEGPDAENATAGTDGVAVVICLTTCTFMATRCCVTSPTAKYTGPKLPSPSFDNLWYRSVRGNARDCCTNMVGPRVGAWVNAVM